MFTSRTAKPLYRKLSRNTAKTQAEVEEAFRKLQLRNGSNLVDGLFVAADQLTAPKGQAGQRGLIVIGDGHFSGDRAILQQIEGELLKKRATVFSIAMSSANVSTNVSADVLSDEGLRGASSAKTRSALGRTSDRSGGHVFSLQIPASNAKMKAMISRIRPRSAVVVEKILIDGEPIWSHLAPQRLSRGSGVTGTILWAGKNTPTVQVEALIDGKPKVLRRRVSANSKNIVDAAAALGRAELAGAIRGENRVNWDSEERRLMLSRAALRVGLVSPDFALVIPAANSPFARERLAFALRWGGKLYRRVPPPSELGRTLSVVRPETFDRLVRNKKVPRGETSKAAIGSRIREHMYRKVRFCYERALRTNSKLEGKLMVGFEIHRDEVVKVSLTGMFGELRLRSCVKTAAYGLKIDLAKADADTFIRVRYPFTLRRSKQGKSSVVLDKTGKVLDPDDPLSGIDEDLD